jgi:hypothetical protein
VVVLTALLALAGGCDHSKAVAVLYVTKINQAVDPAAVACYVAIELERVPRSREPGQVTIELVVVGRESGRFKPGGPGQGMRVSEH